MLCYESLEVLIGRHLAETGYVRIHTPSAYIAGTDKKSPFRSATQLPFPPLCEGLAGIETLTFHAVAALPIPDVAAVCGCRRPKSLTKAVRPAPSSQTGRQNGVVAVSGPWRARRDTLHSARTSGKTLQRANVVVAQSAGPSEEVSYGTDEREESLQIEVLAAPGTRAEVDDDPVATGFGVTSVFMMKVCLKSPGSGREGRRSDGKTPTEVGTSWWTRQSSSVSMPQKSVMTFLNLSIWMLASTSW